MIRSTLAVFEVDGDTLSQSFQSSSPLHCALSVSSFSLSHPHTRSQGESEGNLKRGKHEELLQQLNRRERELQQAHNE